jgi:hypothetical protein
MSEQEVTKSLTSASKVIGTGDTPTFPRSSLAAAIFGAQESIAGVERHLVATMVLACATLSRYPRDSAGSPDPSESVCKQYE